MKCMILFPSWVVEHGFIGGFAEFQAHRWQPTGLMYVAAAIRAAGHDVKLLDGAFITHDDLMQQVREFGPRFVGVYGNTPLWQNTVKTVNDVKKIDKDIFVMAGGPYPIGAGKAVFEGCDNLDASCTGEGEAAATEAIARLEQGESLKGVKGIIYRERKENGTSELVDNGPADLIQDLDALAFPARDLVFPLEMYTPAVGTYRNHPVGTVISSRGCKNRCIYCFQVGKFANIRYRSPANVMQEVRELVERWGAREIRFLDDNFAGDYSWAEDMTAAIRESGLKFSWYISARADCVDYPLLEKMKKAGMWAILFGVESGVQKNLDTLKKNETLDQIRAAVKAAKKAHLKVCTPFIFGIPGETFEDGLQSIKFAVELDAHYVNFHTLAPYPGSSLYKNLDRYGEIVGDLSEHNFEMASFVPHSMSREEIYRLREIAFRTFYRRPKFVVRRILGTRTKQDLKVLYIGAKSFFRLFGRQDVLKHAGSGGYHPETTETPFV